MNHLGRLLLCASLVGCLALPAHAAPEDGPTGLAMVGDLIIARPFGIVATTLGAAAFVVSLPFSALGGNVDQAAEHLVLNPARETFLRCLGCRAAGRHQTPHLQD
jgi:hypothetical protein